ncbi:MAG: chemotaxis protein CheW [Alphaproteobacteria bacterium]|nr:chemotaxis protein CheW [Alphaproteobacteria bacterium]
MDDLLREFLTETFEAFEAIDLELVNLEKNPDNSDIVNTVFRLVHTIKGTCGFLGLPRLEKLTHANETLLGKFRDGMPVDAASTELVFNSIDRIKLLLNELEVNHVESEGSDEDLICKLNSVSGESEHASASVAKITAYPVDIFEKQIAIELFREEDTGEIRPEAEGTIEDARSHAGCDINHIKARYDIKAPPARLSEIGQKQERVPRIHSVRVNVEALEELMEMVSELVLTRNQLLEFLRFREDLTFSGPLHRLSNITAKLREGVMKARMQPIGNAWQKLPRIIRDLSRELGKKINLIMKGEETELDRQVLELIQDPLIHMIRNSADHGLETEEERIALGKPEIGQVILEAYHEGGYIIISVADDGRGLNTEKISQQALKLRLVTQSALDEMSENKIYKFIFSPGFSTADSISNVSGRGVGMDVVCENIESVGGSISLKSAPGLGTDFILKLPLTLTIIPALIIEVMGQRFAIPQLSVIELVRLKKGALDQIERVHDIFMLRVREKFLPVSFLGDFLETHSRKEVKKQKAPDCFLHPLNEDSGFVVIVQVGLHFFGLLVDSVFYTEEIVVKPLSSLFLDIQIFSGTTILGDGKVALILDPNGIAQSLGYVDDLKKGERGVHEAVVADAALEDKGVIPVLVFRVKASFKAIPLSLIMRLEKIDKREIEPLGAHHVFRYGGSFMPIIFIEGSVSPVSSRLQPVIVFRNEDHFMGLAVDQIMDIFEERFEIHTVVDRPGVLGLTVLGGRVTEIVDISYYLPSFSDVPVFSSSDSGLVYSSRILLVDDSVFFRDMFLFSLRSAGFVVTAVESAHKAIELRDEGEIFDVIISDLDMPVMSGFEFASTLRKEPAWMNIPMIALSSYSSPALIEKIQHAGFSDYVMKFDRERLVELLRQQQSQIVKVA